MKWRNRIFWLRILIMVLVIVGSYLAYAFIYRGRNEPPTKRKTTNQEAAYYTLRGQIQMLSQKEELMAFAFEDRKKEREYGTYIMQTADIIQYNYKRQFFRFLKLLCTNAVQFGYLQFSVHNRKALCRSVHYVPAHVVQRYFFPFTSLLITVEKVSIQ